MKKYGISTEDWYKIIAVLSEVPGIKRAILFGSRAKGNFRPFSDIDLVIDGTNLSRNTLLDLRLKLDDLLLPYTIDINLLSSITNQSLLNHIERVGIVIYSAA